MLSSLFKGFPVPTSSPSPRFSKPAREAAASAIERGPVSPLIAVLIPLVVAAILIAAVLSWAFPNVGVANAAPTARFTDVTMEAGIHFQHYNGSTSKEDSPTTLTGAVACLDYNRDGAPDLFFVNGAAWPWHEREDETPQEPVCALYRNDRAGHFTDVTREVGLAISLAGVSVAVADYDNDGWPDLFVTAIGSNHLFRNVSGSHFVDATTEANLPADEHVWSSGALWLDVDGDQRLDLIVCHYARWPREIDLELAFKIAGVGRSYGAPAGFVSVSPTVYRNKDDGRFEDITSFTGLRDIDPITGLPRGQTLMVMPLDANGDGKTDLLFLHQTMEDSLFLNQGKGVFREASTKEERHEGAAATLAAVTAMPSLKMTSPGDVYAKWRGAISGTSGQESTSALSLNLKGGVAILDFDLDGRMEILAGNGKAEPDLNRFDQGRDFAQKPAVYWNRSDAWTLAPVAPDSALLQAVVARGMAVADFDDDGDLDFTLVQNGGPARLFRNDLRSGTAWLRVDLVGTKSPRDGTGARVEIHTPRGIITRWALPSVSLLAQSESTLTFGLAEDTRVRKVVVNWPSGTRQEITSPSINHRLVITEP